MDHKLSLCLLSIISLAVHLAEVHFSRAPRQERRSSEERSDKMRDEMDGRLWVQHGAAFRESVDGFFRSLKLGFERLQAIQFAAPWQKRANCGPTDMCGA